jgi:hypothetical protein
MTLLDVAQESQTFVPSFPNSPSKLKTLTYGLKTMLANN